MNLCSSDNHYTTVPRIRSIFTNSILSKNTQSYEMRYHNPQLKPKNNVIYLFRAALKLERIVKLSWGGNKSELYCKNWP